MRVLPWLLTGLFGAIALFELQAARASYQKLNVLSEYVQFLLFQPTVYQDHRVKFLSFIAQSKATGPTDQAMESYDAIDGMAAAVGDKVILANIVSRRDGKQK